MLAVNGQGVAINGEFSYFIDLSEVIVALRLTGLPRRGGPIVPTRDVDEGVPFCILINNAAMIRR